MFCIYIICDVLRENDVTYKYYRSSNKDIFKFGTQLVDLSLDLY